MRLRWWILAGILLVAMAGSRLPWTTSAVFLGLLALIAIIVTITRDERNPRWIAVNIGVGIVCATPMILFLIGWI